MSYFELVDYFRNNEKGLFLEVDFGKFSPKLTNIHALTCFNMDEIEIPPEGGILNKLNNFLEQKYSGESIKFGIMYNYFMNYKIKKHPFLRRTLDTYGILDLGSIPTIKNVDYNNEDYFKIIIKSFEFANKSNFPVAVRAHPNTALHESQYFIIFPKSSVSEEKNNFYGKITNYKVKAFYTIKSIPIVEVNL